MSAANSASIGYAPNAASQWSNRARHPRDLAANTLRHDKMDLIAYEERRLARLRERDPTEKILKNIEIKMAFIAKLRGELDG